MADFQAKSGNENNKPIPFDNGLSISHSPLNLDGSSSAATPPQTEAEERPIIKDSGKKVSWPERITGVKTFYTKLHPGAMEFLDEQIGKWLMDNPGVTIKMTNAVVGEVQAKKTEPNIILTVWY